MNPAFAGGGIYQLQSSSPSIDAGDERLPQDPDATISDQGALYYDQTPAPDIGISSNPLLFGEVGIGDSADLPLTIYNYGEADLVLFDIYASVPEFSTDFNPADSLIVPEDSLTITVTFAPTEAGAYIETLTIDNNDQSIEVGLLGIGALMGIISPSSNSPKSFAFRNPYPNPFNPETHLVFDLPRDSYVALVIYSTEGCEIARLADGFYTAGSHTVTFNAVGLSSGAYFAKMTADDFEQVQVLTLTK